MKQTLTYDEYSDLLTPNMIKVMFALNKPLSILEVSDNTNIPKSTLYKIFNILIKHKLIQVYDRTRYKSSKERQRTRYICSVKEIIVSKDEITINFL